MDVTEDEAQKEFEKIRQLSVEAEKLLDDLRRTADDLTKTRDVIAEIDSVVTPEIEDLRARLQLAVIESQSAATEAKTGSEVVAKHAKSADEYRLLHDASQQHLSDLHEQYSEAFESLRQTIENLLPGATGAGLAKAFAERKETINKSLHLWKWSFGFGLGLTLLSAVCVLLFPDFFRPREISVTDGQLIWILAVTIPKVAVLGAPLWLAGFSAKQLAVRFRLEEDYAYKEALSMSYEGYNKQMRNVPETGVSGVLASMVLAELSKSPVDLYEKRISTESPVESITDGFKINRPSKSEASEREGI
jgi:hypothetical protein